VNHQSCAIRFVQLVQWLLWVKTISVAVALCRDRILSRNKSEPLLQKLRVHPEKKKNYCAAWSKICGRKTAEMDMTEFNSNHLTRMFVSTSCGGGFVRHIRPQFKTIKHILGEGSAESGFCKEKKITNTQAIRKAYIDITVEIKGEICGLWLRVRTMDG
jgi:hypothetical protein